MNSAAAEKITDILTNTATVKGAESAKRISILVNVLTYFNSHAGLVVEWSQLTGTDAKEATSRGASVIAAGLELVRDMLEHQVQAGYISIEDAQEEANTIINLSNVVVKG